MLIDSHCHLDYEEENELPDVINRANKAGVFLMQTICTKKDSIERIIEIIDRYDCVYGSIGIHPLELKNNQFMTCEEITQNTQHSKIIGIGETGLDYYYSSGNRDEQKKSFLEHINAARITKLPLIIHSRNADSDIIKIIEEQMKISPFTGVFHCFTSSIELALKVIEYDFYISFSGIITFKKSEYLQDVLKITPIDKILIETDSPYLSPEPLRGKKNEPENVVLIAKKISELINLPYDRIIEITTQNFYKLFNKCNKK